jgi:hypothetical protein
MKYSRVQFRRILGAMGVVIVVGSSSINSHLHDRDLGRMVLSIEGLIVGVWIGVVAYDWVLRRSE